MTALPPIHRSLRVAWTPEAAFERFTTEFDRWWPSKSHSIGGARLARVVFEARAGGAIFEEHSDGRRFCWGEVLAIDAPGRIEFTWHPSRDASTAQRVTVTFLPDAEGTLVELTADGWERWGSGADRARRGYRIGWGYVLNVWAERRTPSMALIDLVAGAIGVVQRLRGGVEGRIARAGGEMPRA